MISSCVLLLSGSCAGPDQLTAEETLRKTVSEQDYHRAEQLLSWNVQPKVLNSDIEPKWIDGERFWYRTRTREGERFFRVDPDAGEHRQAFDHERLADTLGAVLNKEVEAGELPFETFQYVRGETAIQLDIGDRIWECELEEYQCIRTDHPEEPDHSVLSPNERWAAFIRDHNLWIRDMSNGEEFALTTAGEHRYGFATNSQGWSRSERPVLHWSPDSRKIATYRLDERNVEEMHLLETAQNRPILESWPYALPGDSIVPMHERVVLDVENRTVTWLDVEPSHQRTSNCCGLERDGQWADNAWSEDGSRLAFVATSRDYSEVNLYIADTESGDVRHVYKEQAETFFESNLTSRGVPNWRVLFDRDEFIWFSRHDEWGHLYLHRLDDGSRINRITSGEWNVVDLLHIDKNDGMVYFTAAGKEAGRDPYLQYLYKADLQGGDPSEPELLTPEEANHEIFISPSGRFIVDEYSAFQQPSVTVLRNEEGGEVMPLEESDITSLRETGWRVPEPFVVKARDGETDLYGLMYKPSDFDPSNSYPVVISIYPGPQIGSVGTRSFTPVRRGQPHALAELGFIVVQIDALGTPLRSKSFHTAWYGDMSDNGIEDQIAGIRQLGDRYDWLDADRAGIFGHSGGGYATASALLRFPGVFKAGVASAGNMDNRSYTYYWGEKYQGPRTVEHGRDSFASQAIWKKAGNLEDRLLITYGTTDSNVHPNMSLLLVNELIKENKDFDLIVMPNRGHGYANEKYHIRRTWDYFVRHLFNTNPPREYAFE